MDQVLFLKFTQHQDLKDELLATGNAELIEVTSAICCILHSLILIYAGLL